MKRYYLGERDRGKLAKLLRGEMAANRIERRQSVRGAMADRFPPPFKVRHSEYDPDINSGSPTWLIWLPYGHDCLYCGTTAINVVSAAGLVAHSGVPVGWYELEDITSTGDVTIYMHVDVSDLTSPSIEFSESSTPSATMTNPYTIVVATFTYDSSTRQISIKQGLVGTLTLGGSGGSTYTPPKRPFDIFSMEDSEGNVVHYLARMYYQRGNLTATATSSGSTIESFTEQGLWVLALKVGTTTSDTTATVVGYTTIAAMQADQANENYAVVPLYAFDSTATTLTIDCDFRAMTAVQIFEVLS